MSIALQKRQGQDSRETDELLRASVERVRQIADDLLKKFVTGDFYEQEFESVDLRKMVESLFSACRESWPGLQAQITGDSTAIVKCKNRSQIERAFSNLINNAVEAQKDPTLVRIEIKIASSNGNFIVDVFDNGPGVPETIRHSIFNRGVTHGKASGTGLGLAQVKEYMESVGGSIELIPSRSGAHFQLRVPKLQSVKHSIEIHRNLILVDDNVTVLKNWTARFQALGANVTTYSNPEQFLNVPLTPQTTVITDLIFSNSERTGFDVLERSHSNGCQSILCSSLGDNQEVAKMTRGHAQILMTKNQLDMTHVTIKSPF